MPEQTIGTVYVPVIERAFYEYAFDICPSDLERFGVKTLEELVEGIRENTIRIWDIDQTDIELIDSEIVATYDEESTANCHLTNRTLPDYRKH